MRHHLILKIHTKSRLPNYIVRLCETPVPIKPSLWIAQNRRKASNFSQKSLSWTVKTALIYCTLPIAFPPVNRKQLAADSLRFRYGRNKLLTETQERQEGLKQKELYTGRPNHKIHIILLLLHYRHQSLGIFFLFLSSLRERFL